jgi:hypothetical protein
MIAKQETNEKSISLEFPTSGYKKTLFFNNFKIETIDTGLFFCFWFLHKNGYVGDEFSCFISMVDLNRCAESFKKYIEKLNTGPKDFQNDMPSGISIKNAPLVRHMRGTRVGDVAELQMSFFPLSSITGDTPEDAIIRVEPVAVLMSNLQTHVNFVCSFLNHPEVQK